MTAEGTTTTETLLILTNSHDASADWIVSDCRRTNKPCFRWNVDLWQHYGITWGSSQIIISDPLHRKIDLLDDGVALLWRKPFPDLMDFDEAVGIDDRKMARRQMQAWLGAVVALMLKEQRVRLIEPYADIHLPKLFQLEIAREFFSVPDFYFSLHPEKFEWGDQVIAKPLSDPAVGDAIFYSSYTSKADLASPYPWFVQQPIIGGVDITCVHIMGQNYFYCCDFPRDKANIDWRQRIHTTDPVCWSRCRDIRLHQVGTQVTRFMKAVNLHYGRVDFILYEDEFLFLECNSNGQFGWLDNETSPLLHRAFLEAAFDRSSIVRSRGA